MRLSGIQTYTSEMPLPFFAEVQRFFSTDVYVYVVLVQHWEESAELPRIIPGVHLKHCFRSLYLSFHANSATDVVL